MSAQAAPAATPTRPQRPSRLGVRLVVAVIAAAAIWSYVGLGFDLRELIDAPVEAWNVVRRMFPPAFREEIERGVIGKVMESVYIAWIGTIIGAALSFPLAFVAANNVSPRWLRIPVRLLFDAIRAVPELIVAMVLLSVTGLGPWAGALAIGLHSIGTLGKLATEAIETADDGPLEAIEAAGGRWVSAMRWGMLPQVFPIVVGYWLFRFEINVRASAVLGLIGAGGVGAELNTQIAFRNFPAVGAVLVFTVVAVLIIDFASSAVRRRIIAGRGRPPQDDPSRMMTLVEDGLGSAIVRS
jgi:phosphonate transport system permease protein